MGPTKPLITPEEMQSLLGDTPSGMRPARFSFQWQPLHWGVALWSLKGLCLFVVLMSPEATQLVVNHRYLWLRGSLELLCLAVFEAAVFHPKGRNVAHGAMLVASTTLLMDVMVILSFTG